jgi:hypothetical protein
MTLIPNGLRVRQVRVANFAAAGTQTPLAGFIHGGTTGLDWLDVKCSGGLAWGDVNFLANHYDDATCVWPGLWGPNQRVEALVRTTNQLISTDYQEIEIRLRTSITPHVLSGYEVNWRCTHDGSQYHQLVQWYGPIGVTGSCTVGCAFDLMPGSINPGGNGMDATHGNGVPGLYDRDIIGAQIIGNHLTTWIVYGPNSPNNGVRVVLQDFFDTGGAGGGAKFTGVNADGTTQNPGIAHWHHATAGSPSDFGHEWAVATEL